MNRSLPLVTIITPSFNQGQFIETTIRSVLAQTYINIEYIIIDALSTDATAGIIDLYRDKISRVIQEPDKGQSDAIVKGFKLAKGELVGWINSDDLLYPNCVTELVEAYERNPDAVLFYDTYIDFIGGDGNFIRRMDVPFVDRNHLLRKYNRLAQPGSFYSKSALEKVDYLDVRLNFSMDLDLWLRLLEVGRGVNYGKGPVAAYREWIGTKTVNGKDKLLYERRQLLIRHGAKSLDRSIAIINLVLLKHFVRSALTKRFYIYCLERIGFFICLVLYYGFFRYLPASNSRFTRWTRFLRRIACKPLFRSAGSNINIEKVVHSSVRVKKSALATIQVLGSIVKYSERWS